MAKLWSCMFLLVIAHSCKAYTILLVSPIPSGSHAILGEACVKILLEAGHEVTYVTAMPNRLPRNPKLSEVDVSSNAKYFPLERINITSLLENQSEQPSLSEILYVSSFYSIEIVKHDAVQRALKDGSKRFDLVIAEWMFSEIYAGLPALLDCPLVWLSTMEPHSTILSLVDDLPNPTYNADFGVTHIGPYSFIERVGQLLLQIFLFTSKAFHVYFKETKDFNDLYAPMMEELGKKLLPYNELRYNASLVLSNSHESLGQPIRLPPNFIPVGGYHIDPEVKPLPKDLKNIMDDSKQGVIYFSMGSILKSKDFPKNLKMNLLKMLGSLKQTVLWKFEEDFPNLPNNVHVLKWASQQSILDHPNCVLFITHGGLLSLAESIHYAVPIIGVPAFADQFANIIRAERKGFAKNVDLSYNLADDLKIAIKEVLENPRYKEKVNELSFSYHDRPVRPRKALIHWVEHVIRTRGALVMKSPALKVPFYQRYFLDLAALIIVIMVVLQRIVPSFKNSIRLMSNDNAHSLGIKKNEKIE